MTNEKKWIFSKAKLIAGIFIILLALGYVFFCFAIDFFESESSDAQFLYLLIWGMVALFVFIGLKLALSYCAYNKKTLFVYSFFRCKEIDFENIKAIYHTSVTTHSSRGSRTSDKWTVCYQDKAENCEKEICPQFANGESKEMHGFFAALKAVHPCKICCHDYKENYEGYDDILDVWQELDGYESESFPFNGTVYSTFVMPFEMENDDVSPLKEALFCEEGVLNEDEEEAYEDEEFVGISKKDKIELIGVEEKSSDIKEFAEKWRLTEKTSAKICNLVEKADGYYKIFKNGEEFACEYDGVSAKYRVVKLGKKCALFSFHLEK